MFEERISDYLRFLAYCLDTEHRTVPDCVSRINWHDLLIFARKQTIVGVYWGAMQGLRDFGDNKPSGSDVAEWLGTGLRIQQMNHTMDEASRLACERFAKAGFGCCVLKGQGNALCYPDPSLRQPGDVDLWCYSGKSVSRNRRLVTDFVRRHGKKATMRYHHVDYDGIPKVPVEVHFMPSYLNNPFANRRLQAYFSAKAAEQTGHINVLGFASPTDDFNRVFQMTHLVKHFFDEGVGFRQLVDYYYLLRKGLTREDRRRDMELLGELRLQRFVAAVMWVLSEVLGLEERYLLCEPDERYGKILLDEILSGGNFGHYAANDLSRQKSYRKYFMKTARNLRLVRVCPSEALWEPWFRTWHFFWRAFHR